MNAKPKRTIRFIHWTGEEQGLLGSHGYVEKHKDEMSKISAVLVDDGGTELRGRAGVHPEHGADACGGDRAGERAVL